MLARSSNGLTVQMRISRSKPGRMAPHFQPVSAGFPLAPRHLRVEEARDWHNAPPRQHGRLMDQQ